jgi:hypothetical protein
MTSPARPAPMTIEVLHVPDCPNLAPMLARLREVTDIPATTREVLSDADAQTLGMAGSPTLLINGVDPFASEDACECGISCRLYRDEDNKIVPAPSVEQLRVALAATSTGANAECPDDAAECAVGSPGDRLSNWRTRALPADPLQRAVHRAILRTFASTGRPPTLDDLHRSTGANQATLDAILYDLHHGDAIRLDDRGQIVVAYPFSATPTRHRVAIEDSISVHAMCGIDALGIPAMLGRDVCIETTDPTTGDQIIVTTDNGRTTWNPQDAVAFVGAHASRGPSADCCCEYLNLFANQATAAAWSAANANIPGQILSQTEAEELASTLFGALLTPAEGRVTMNP